MKPKESLWYDAGYKTAKKETVDKVLEIIDRSTAYAKELDETIADKADGMMVATSAIRKAVLALKRGDEE